MKYTATCINRKAGDWQSDRKKPYKYDYMKKRPYIPPFGLFLLILFSCQSEKRSGDAGLTLYKNANIITGDGKTILTVTDFIVKDGTIDQIGKGLNTDGAAVVDLKGKTVMPTLISAHTHIGNLKGNSADGKNFNRENVLRQLKKYQDYGVLWVQSLGTDQASLYRNGLFDSIKSGKIDGARMLSAGWGFGVPTGAPPFPDHHGDDNIFRPTDPGEISADMDTLKKYPVDFVKIWVDNFGKNMPVMSEKIYSEIIKQAHSRNMKVVSHLYYINDGKRLAKDGIDLFGHSIRDAKVDNEIIGLMKAKKIPYIPTLSLDDYAYVYSYGKASWINDPFFKKSLEPTVFEMISSPDFRVKQAKEQDFNRSRSGLENAMYNAKKLYDSGILVGMGTDSGAMVTRPQGFSEHHELELFVRAGFTPLQAIQLATLNSAKILGLDKQYGTFEKGKVADFIVVNGDPSKTISDTQKISAVYKAGKKVSKGPLSN